MLLLRMLCRIIDKKLALVEVLQGDNIVGALNYQLDMDLPMFIVGGTANWSRRTNRYKGSACTEFYFTTVPTTTVLINGEAMRRAYLMPITIDFWTLDDYKT